MTSSASDQQLVDLDTLRLRFRGAGNQDVDLHELHAAHVAEVLQGVVGLASDFSKAGAFGEVVASDVLVRPAAEGSFVMEIVRAGMENPDLVSAVGVPGLGSIIWWATKSVRADVADYDYLDNGKVKVLWQDNTVDEIPREVWEELQKRKRRRKRHLRQIMAPLGDPRVSTLEVNDDEGVADDGGAPGTFELTRPDYQAVLPFEDVVEDSLIFEVEAQMSAIDFDDPEKWRVKTSSARRSATVEDEDFLGEVAGGRAIRPTDIFQLRVREDMTVKDGRTRRKWTVLKVLNHRRAFHDDDD